MRTIYNALLVLGLVKGDGTEINLDYVVEYWNKGLNRMRNPDNEDLDLADEKLIQLKKPDAQYENAFQDAIKKLQEGGASGEQIAAFQVLKVVLCPERQTQKWVNTRIEDFTMREFDPVTIPDQLTQARKEVSGSAAACATTAASDESQENGREENISRNFSV